MRLGRGVQTTKMLCETFLVSFDCKVEDDLEDILWTVKFHDQKLISVRINNNVILTRNNGAMEQVSFDIHIFCPNFGIARARDHEDAIKLQYQFLDKIKY